MDEDEKWTEAIRLVSDWAAHNGLRASFANDPGVEPEFDADFLSVTLDPRPDSAGVTMARPTVATLMKRYIVTQKGVRLAGYGPFIEVRLVRHGRDPGRAVVDPHELHRFGMEARHLDRID